MTLFVVDPGHAQVPFVDVVESAKGSDIEVQELHRDRYQHNRHHQMGLGRCGERKSNRPLHVE